MRFVFSSDMNVGEVNDHGGLPRNLKKWLDWGGGWKMSLNKIKSHLLTSALK